MYELKLKVMVFNVKVRHCEQCKIVYRKDGKGVYVSVYANKKIWPKNFLITKT